MRKFKKRIIVITGTPGVGKTSTSRLLALKLEAGLINLGELIKSEKLFSGIDEKRGSLVADMEKVSRRVQQIISSSEQRDVIIEGHFAVDVLPSEAVHKVFVLRRNPEELKGILLERGFKGSKLWENLAAEILDVCLWDAVKLCGVDKVCEIDATGRRIEEVVKAIISILNGEKKCKAGQIDWLGKLDAEGKLDLYLKHFAPSP
ncbi:MAG: adenylate kinase family protein [Candidatus Bathyarchaeia archaeon]